MGSHRNLAVFFGLFLMLAAPAEAAAETLPPVPDSAASTSGAPASAFTERTMGKADAPLTIYEYAMLTCSHCAEVHTGPMIKIKKNYVDTGLVKIIYRDLPFDEVALKAAAAARCVPEEGYFSFIDALFMQQNVWAKATDPMVYVKQLAGFTGLTPALFDACIADQKLLDHLLQVRVDGSNKYQINSTPTFVFEDGIEKMVGTQTFAQYAATIDRKLKEKGVTPPAPEAAPKAK